MVISVNERGNYIMGTDEPCRIGLAWQIDIYEPLDTLGSRSDVSKACCPWLDSVFSSWAASVGMPSSCWSSNPCCEHGIDRYSSGVGLGTVVKTRDI